MSKKDIVKVEGATNALIKQFEGVHVEEDIQAGDLISPKLLMVQSQSKAFLEGKAKLGDYVVSGTQEIVIPQGSTVDFIAMRSWRDWVVMLESGNKYLRTEPITMRPDRPRKEMEQGVSIVHYERQNYFVLLTNELKEDSDGFLPYTLSFRSTSLMASKAIKSTIIKASMAGKKVPMPFFVFSLGSEAVKNDKGSWFNPVIKKVRMSTEDELVHVKTLIELMSVNTYAVDESDLVEEEVDVNQVNQIKTAPGVQVEV